MLTAPQQPVPGKFKVSLVIGFEPRIMCHLLGLHFPVFKLTNWATLTDIKLLLILYTHYYPLSPILLLKFMESRYFYVQVTLKLMEKFHQPYCQMEEYLNHPKCNFVINMPISFAYLENSSLVNLPQLFTRFCSIQRHSMHSCRLQR